MRSQVVSFVSHRYGGHQGLVVVSFEERCREKWWLGVRYCVDLVGHMMLVYGWLEWSDPPISTSVSRRVPPRSSRVDLLGEEMIYINGHE